MNRTPTTDSALPTVTGWSWRDSESAGCPRIATSEWCWTATHQRHQHLCCEYLPNASYGDRADLLVGQLQLQLTARGAGIVAGLVRTERAAPALEITALVGCERCHADYPCAVGEDQGCRTRVGRHSHDGSGTDRVVAAGGSDLNVAARPGAAVAAGHERPQLGMTARSTAYPDVREPYAVEHQRCGRLSSRVRGCTGRLKLGPGQVQASWERCCQYPWAGSARSPRAARCAGARLSVAAARLAESCPVVAAPDRTTSTHGWCSTAARATASGVAASSSAVVRSATGMPDSRPASRPLASASLTMTAQPACLASARARPAEGSSRFQVTCTLPKSGTPATVTSSAARTASRCSGPLVDRPTVTPSAASRARRRCMTGSVSAGLCGVTE